tara:strand:- start:171 stop:488 length:318 start_codon:yes stop_codon:yes gene_type:complete
MLLNNIITIDDNPVTLNQKLARIEAKAIIEDFEKDFGFDLLALPNLDLPLNIYCDELVKIENEIKLAKQEQDKKVLTAWLDELENSDECIQCIDNSVNHHCSCQY